MIKHGSSMILFADTASARNRRVDPRARAVDSHVPTLVTNDSFPLPLPVAAFVKKAFRHCRDSNPLDKIESELRTPTIGAP